VLCLNQIRQRETRTAPQAPPLARTQAARIRHKMGPLWKLMHIIEPLPKPTSALTLRDEKNELLTLDGPFAETKA
jgi:hypothetical protein